MKINFLVTVTIGPNEKQATKDFEKEDGKAMIPYLKEKLQEAIEPYETCQYNAIVKKASVRRQTK